MIYRTLYATDIETILKDQLIKHNINFCFQYPIRCKYGYIADFFIPEVNLIVEADGERWHNKKRDNAKNGVLKKLGFSIIRFTGTQIKTNSENCIQQIIELIERRNIIQ